MVNDQSPENLRAAVRSIEDALADIKRRLDAGEILDEATAASLDVIRRESVKLRDSYIVYACASGMRQCKVAAIFELSAGRIVQILAEQSVATK